MAEWKPNPGPQESFHRSTAFELFYGGAAGGGKSESLLVEALRYVHVPGYSAILFRRTFPELRQARGLIERSRSLYPQLGGKYNEQAHMWRFPSGATIGFGQMEHEQDKYDHQSAEYAYIGFDELTTFDEAQYLYLFSRARTTAVDPETGKTLKPRIRAASNPGNVGHEWVRERWGAWIISDPETGVPPAKSGDIRYYKKVDDVEVETTKDDPAGLSRQFIGAKLSDNPKLVEADPQYKARLESLSPIDRMRLLDGNWDVLIAGNEFKPEHFKIIEPRGVPEGLTWYRYWDLAASIKTKADFSASPSVAVDSEANVYIRDMIRLKMEWPDFKKVMKNTILSEMGITKTHGIEKKVHGLAALQELMRDPDLVGVARIEGIEVDADKLSRARVWSPRVAMGKVYLVKGPWVPSFLTEAALFDGEGKAHDDQIDGVSGAIQMLTPRKWSRMKFLHL